MGYSRDFIKGLGWVGFFRYAAKLLIFVKVVVAYRYLSPQQVGIFGLAAISLGLVEMLTETGINVILIRDTKPITYYLDTAFIVSIVRGLLISIALAVLAIFLPTFFRDPLLFFPLIWASVIPLIRGFINPSIAKFQKDLHFEKEAGYRLFLTCFDVITAVVLVSIFKDATSLVWAMSLTAITEVMLSHLIVTPRPQFHFNLTICKEIISPGKWINVVGIISFAEQNFDNIVVGRLLGSTQLGYYQTAYNLTRSLVLEAGTAISQVLLPIYGRLVGDEARLKRAVFRIFIPAVILLSIPAIALNIPLVQEWLIFFLKDKWRPMLPLLPFLSTAAWITGIDVLVNPLFIVKNKIKELAFLYGLGLIFMLITMAILIQTNGLIGAALALLLARAIVQPFFLLFTMKHMKNKTI